MKNIKLSTILLGIFGGLIVMPGLILLLLGIGMAVDSDPEASRISLPIIIVSNIFLIPGGVLLFLSYRNARYGEQEQLLVNLAKAYRRIPLKTLAEKMDLPEARISSLLSAALDSGRLKGYIDRKRGEFFTEEGQSQKLEIRFCSSCGAPLERSYYQGEQIKCNSCGSILA